jgi:hypothetical protein
VPRTVAAFDARPDRLFVRHTMLICLCRVNSSATKFRYADPAHAGISHLLPRHRFVSCHFTMTYVTLAQLNEYSFSEIVAHAGATEKGFMRGAGTDRSDSRANAAIGRRLAEGYWTADTFFILRSKKCD